jgi:hypothetical protein
MVVDTTAAASIEIRDLVVSTGPRHREQVLVAGLDLTVLPTELVTLEVAAPDALDALLSVFAGQTPPTYGSFGVGRPTVVRPGRLGSDGLPPRRPGTDDGRRDDDPRADFLDWDHCRKLAADGHLIASHGVDHTPMNTLTSGEAERQVGDSLAELQRRLGRAEAVYAYPYGIEAEIPAHIDGFGPLTAFGSVKAAPAQWDLAPLAIRRTYLPSDDENAWPALVGSWLNAWHRMDGEDGE